MAVVKSFPAIEAIRTTEEELCSLGQVLMSYREYRVRMGSPWFRDGRFNDSKGLERGLCVDLTTGQIGFHDIFRVGDNPLGGFMHGGFQGGKRSNIGQCSSRV
jgi:hypothetical protein